MSKEITCSAQKGKAVCTPIQSLEKLMTSFYNFSATDIRGKNYSFADLKGKVVLVVNVASACGLTPQYKGLQELYSKYESKGFIILGFPCNQFGHQESGTEDEIVQFCEARFAIKFPLMSKIDVNGENTHPVFKWLKSEAPGVLGTELIKWNFTKFLISREGLVLKRFSPQDEPASLISDIEKAIG
jgi:glutathione peroxidase